MISVDYRTRLFCLGIFLLFCFLSAGQTFAAVVIAGTRVIYPAQDKEVTLRINNNSDQPSLVQVWLDRGDPKSEPDKVNVPFVMTPPIFRVDPAKAQTLRITYTREPLPQDKESVFWLNVLDIPSVPAGKSKEEADNYLRFAFRSRIKLFFRPSDLPGTPIDAAQGLSWQAIDSAKGTVLRCTNGSAYHVTIDQVMADDNGKRLQSAGEMLSPGETRDFPFNGRVGRNAKLSYSWINDYGSGVVQPIALSR